jgi:hypothetical protein
MGGPGAGHKSWEARQSRMANIAKARAARRRAPLPWRSGMESRIIEQLVWQWWMTTASGEWSVASGERCKDTRAEMSKRGFDAPDPPGSTIPQAPLTGDLGGPVWRRPGRPLLTARKRNGDEEGQGRAQSVTGGATRPAFAKATADKPWAKYKVARFLGVSHTWVNKLVKRFEADPDRMRRRMAAFAPASFEKLEIAREETRRQRERGWLRGPIRTRRVKLKREGWKRTVVLATQAEKRRRQAEIRGLAEGPLHVRYQELPVWAKGLLLPGDVGKTTGLGTGARVAGRARPFAFRRRRW